MDATAKAVLSYVVRNGPVSRADISGHVDLSAGSVTRVTKPLLADGWLRECDAVPTAFGRPIVPLDVVDEAVTFVGIKVVAGRIYAVRTGLKGTVHAATQRDADTDSLSATARGIAEVARELAGDAVVRIGVALAAAVDVSGDLPGTRLLGWPAGNLSAEVTRITGMACVAGNDVNALTLAEHWFGSGRGARDFVVVTIGVGVGAGVVSGDRLLDGHRGAIGMLGYVRLPTGRLAGEALASGAIAERVSAIVARDVDYEEALALASDARVGVELQSCARDLGALAGLCNVVYAPERVLLTGDGIGLAVWGRADIESEFLASALTGLPAPELVVSQIGFEGWARGGAALAIRSLLA